MLFLSSFCSNSPPRQHASNFPFPASRFSSFRRLSLQTASWTVGSFFFPLVKFRFSISFPSPHHFFSAFGHCTPLGERTEGGPGFFYPFVTNSLCPGSSFLLPFAFKGLPAVVALPRRRLFFPFFGLSFDWDHFFPRTLFLFSRRREVLCLPSFSPPPPQRSFLILNFFFFSCEGILNIWFFASPGYAPPLPPLC